MDKKFLTYNQQMRYLRDKKEIKCEGSKDKVLLCKSGYFNLINGYKEPFISGIIQGSHKYMKDTTIKQLYEVKKFDDELRMHLLKYITMVEEEIRTLVGYKFDEVNNEGKIEWYNINAYDVSQDSNKIVKVISDAFQQVNKSEQSYIKHYFEKYKYVPTWILVKTINFSTLIDFIECSKIKLKDDICNLFNIKKDNGKSNYKLLIGSLHWLRKVRNSCAHNERIYGISRSSSRISTMYDADLPRSYSRERDQKLIDLIIYMRYYLPNPEYKKFVGEIKKLLINLKKILNINSFNKVRADMGIKDISHLDILDKKIKNIEYNKF